MPRATRPPASGARPGASGPAERAPTPPARRPPTRRRRGPGHAARLVVAAAVGAFATYLGVCVLLLGVYRFVNPLTTGVQVQRRLEALASGEAYEKRYAPVGREDQGRHLRHAVVAAEDGRFYVHAGFDLDALREAREQAERTGRPMRGASTLTQQLVKNLFLTTHRSLLRKAFEVPLTVAAELILPKERILDLYLNVAEWGDGVFGAEAAARHHYRRSAAGLTRNQSARLAACLPAPRTRTPARMGWYARLIERRMRGMGW